MDSLRVGVLGGTRLPGNVQTFLDNVGSLLDGASVEFDLDLVLRGGVVDDAAGLVQYDIVDPGIPATDRAVGTVLELTRALTRYARAENPDVLWQVTKFPSHGFAATVAGKRSGVPTVTRFAGDNFREYLFAGDIGERTRTYLLNNVLGRIPAVGSDATIVLGPYGREQIERRGGTNVCEIPQPVDRDKFHPPNRSVSDIRENTGIQTDTDALLTVGRLSRRKGMEDLLSAARSLTREGADLRWYVVGDGPLRARLDSVPIVEAPGRVPHDEMPAYYQGADLVVHPSLAEGLPNVLLEAAACGTPTLARDVGDCTRVASETFNDPDRLPTLVRREYEPVTLGPSFDPDRLQEAYVRVLGETARRR